MKSDAQLGILLAAAGAVIALVFGILALIPFGTAVVRLRVHVTALDASGSPLSGPLASLPAGIPPETVPLDKEGRGTFLVTRQVPQSLLAATLPPPLPRFGFSLSAPALGALVYDFDVSGFPVGRAPRDLGYTVSNRDGTLVGTSRGGVFSADPRNTAGRTVTRPAAAPLLLWHASGSARRPDFMSGFPCDWEVYLTLKRLE